MAFNNEKWANIRLGGAFFSDTWSMGIWIRFPDGVGLPSPADMATFTAAVLAAFNTQVWSASSDALAAHNQASITLSRAHGIYYVNGHATTSADSTITAVVGTGGANLLAPYTAQVCTLLTGLSGRANRGRVYMPTTSLALGANLQAQAARCTAAVGQIKAWLDAVNALTTPIETSHTHRVIIGSKTITGLSAPVTDLRVDSILDTQRGRGDNFIASTIATATLA